VSDKPIPEGGTPQPTGFTRQVTSQRPLDGPSATMVLRSTQRQVAPKMERDRALLVRVDSVNAGRLWRIERGPFGLGRHPDNQGLLDDDGISRFHARVTPEDGNRYRMEDLNSSNGTFVNGERITTCELRNGDTVQLGPRVSFRFSLASEHEEQVLNQLYESSVRDPLTQAYNRQHFSSRMLGEIAFAVRHKVELALLIVDLDFFKKINDGHGHLAGDAVLREITGRIQEQLRTEDLLARYGGEEFVVMLRNTPLDKAKMAGERLRKAVEGKPVQHEAKDINVTISCGCATLGECKSATLNDLIAVADRRLYKAKSEGRNRVIASG
jgi:diguanylate cyclase (GGDEF)-like protein